ncbi:MAG: RNA polymerase sigma-70 factor [Bacteroidales bacterium]|nr:RNA polymerase sigma-70 factor [Bacteroidales bacterium]
MVPEDDASVLFNISLFEKFFRNHYVRFCFIALRYLNDKDLAEEVVQEVFAKIWEKRNQIEVKGSLTAYFSMAIKNTSLNYLKHRKVEIEFAQNYFQSRIEDSTNIELEERLIERVREAIEKLPPQRKKIFLMSRNEGMKYQEIADALHLSVKTVEAQMGLALKFLREQLKEYLQ